MEAGARGSKGMITLVAFLCLNGVCEEHRLPAPIGLVGCMVTGQAELARAFPRWEIKWWRCETR
jgi:hypothetical protein